MKTTLPPFLSEIVRRANRAAGKDQPPIFGPDAIAYLAELSPAFRKRKTTRAKQAAQRRAIAKAVIGTPAEGIEISCADYTKLTGLKDMLLTYGKALDEAHDQLSQVVEDDLSSDDIRDKAISLCYVLNSFHEARKLALGPDGVLPLPTEIGDGENAGTSDTRRA